MALSIKDPDLDRDVRRLARARNTTLTGAIKLAVSNELQKIEPRFSPEEKARRLANIRNLQKEIAEEGIDWSLTEDEILGYDEHGLPH